MNIIEKSYKWNGTLSTRKTTTHLILHHAAATVCSADDVHRWHVAKDWVGIGYNYFVRKDGSTYRGRPENAIGAHTVGYNSKSIGICFEGNFQNETMPDAQRHAGIALVSDIMSRYPNLKIGGHGEFDSTACPGTNFPLAAIKNYKNYIMEDNSMEIDKIISLDGTGSGCSDWAKEAVEFCKDKGIFSGDGSGNFGWQKPITREAVAVIIKSVIDKLDISL